jgi:D-glycero-D-manno-heptose 1,7-bisphosphate phosphatase
MNWSDIKLVIFDADETLRRRKDGKNSAPLADDEWEIMPGMVEAIDSIKYRTLTFGIASNQACVGRGEIENYKAHVMLNKLARNLDLAIDIEGPCIQMCPHLPGTCSCRKPHPGMLYSIMMYWEVAPKETLFIGDAISDRKAAENCGCHFMNTNQFLGKE